MGVAERWAGFEELPEDIDERVERLGPVMASWGVRLAYLFGSLTRPGSQAHDVDLALLCDGRVEALRETIGAPLGTQRLDLVDLASAPPLLGYHIISTGRPMVVSDEAERVRFEVTLLQRLHDTEWLRRRHAALQRQKAKRWS